MHKGIMNRSAVALRQNSSASILACVQHISYNKASPTVSIIPTVPFLPELDKDLEQLLLSHIHLPHVVTDTQLRELKHSDVQLFFAMNARPSHAVLDENNLFYKDFLTVEHQPSVKLHGKPADHYFTTQNKPLNFTEFYHWLANTIGEVSADILLTAYSQPSQFLPKAILQGLLAESRQAQLIEGDNQLDVVLENGEVWIKQRFDHIRILNNMPQTDLLEETIPGYIEVCMLLREDQLTRYVVGFSNSLLKDLLHQTFDRNSFKSRLKLLDKEQEIAELAPQEDALRICKEAELAVLQAEFNLNFKPSSNIAEVQLQQAVLTEAKANLQIKKIALANNVARRFARKVSGTGYRRAFAAYTQAHLERTRLEDIIRLKAEITELEKNKLHASIWELRIINTQLQVAYLELQLTEKQADTSWFASIRIKHLVRSQRKAERSLRSLQSIVPIMHTSAGLKDSLESLQHSLHHYLQHFDLLDKAVMRRHTMFMGQSYLAEALFKYASQCRHINEVLIMVTELYLNMPSNSKNKLRHKLAEFLHTQGVIDGHGNINANTAAHKNIPELIELSNYLVYKSNSCWKALKSLLSDNEDDYWRYKIEISIHAMLAFIQNDTATQRKLLQEAQKKYPFSRLAKLLSQLTHTKFCSLDEAKPGISDALRLIS